MVLLGRKLKKPKEKGGTGLNRKKKESVVAELNETLNAARAAFVTDFKGLSVERISVLRRKVGDAGGQYRVSKNTLTKIAAKGSPAEGIIEYLNGNNAIGTTDGDPVALAKALIDFAKTEDKFVVKGGVLTGKSVSFDQIKAISELPSRDVLLAQMLGALNAVPTGLVRVLAALPQNLVYALAAIRDQKETASA
jgi:large subunit ribosomal protein L10